MHFVSSGSHSPLLLAGEIKIARQQQHSRNGKCHWKLTNKQTEKKHRKYKYIEIGRAAKNLNGTITERSKKKKSVTFDKQTNTSNFTYLYTSANLQLPSEHKILFIIIVISRILLPPSVVFIGALVCCRVVSVLFDVYMWADRAEAPIARHAFRAPVHHTKGRYWLFYCYCVCLHARFASVDVCKHCEHTFALLLSAQRGKIEARSRSDSISTQKQSIFIFSLQYIRKYIAYTLRLYYTLLLLVNIFI